MANEMNTLEIQEIMKSLPHRYPFLMIDRVIDFELGKTLHALKNVTINEQVFQGHFPAKPVFPGVLLMEAMAQATGILADKTWPSDSEGATIFYLASVDNARFKRPVVPGDTVHFHVDFIRERRGMAKFDCRAEVDGKVVCSAEIMCARREA